MSGPLGGVRVVDLTRMLPGAFGVGLLGDLGADVVKVEQPLVGDEMRTFEPRLGEESAFSWVTDRNRRSLSIELKDRRGAEALKCLVAGADALVESFRPGVMDRLGVGYEQLREVNPRLVYCAITGYGQDGPLRRAPGHDLNYIGRAGLMGVIGTADGPLVPGVQIADVGGGGLMSCIGVLAALLRARESGEGEFVDISMCDGAFAVASIHAGAYLASGCVPSRAELPPNGGVPHYNVYRCADGEWITVAAVEVKFFARLCEAVGRPDLLDTHDDPGKTAAWRDVFRTRTAREWLELLEPLDACVGPVNDLATASTDPQLRARDMVIELDDRHGHPQPQIGTPIKFGKQAAGPRTPIPAVGEQTEDILAELGFAPTEIDDLFARGIAYDANRDSRPPSPPQR